MVRIEYSSTEFYKELLELIYKRLLTRKPTNEKIEHYLSLLLSNKITIDEVRENILKSDEFNRLKSAYLKDPIRWFTTFWK